VAVILNLIANGMGEQDSLVDYPYLEPEDIRQALAHAAWLADESAYIPELASA
jgi:uncharacterized protein (DUF433 family)